MKLRIRGNSLRFRLLQREVEKLVATGSISEEIRFSNSESLRYTLCVSKKAYEIVARFSGREIVVTLQEGTAAEWAISDGVGIEFEQPVGDGESLNILIEKDFVCIGRTDDPDNADAFPNPKFAHTEAA
jgi:hypothetical protein